MSYAELHCISNFSFLRGASHPEELVAEAARQGYRALAITDECSLAGVVKAHVAAREHGLQLIVGAEFRLEGELLLVLLAPDRRAYAELSGLITLARRRSPKGEYALGLRDFELNARHCLAIWLPGAGTTQTLLARGEALRALFAGRLWLGVELLLLADEQQRYLWLYQLATRLGLPMVACGGVEMHVAERKALADTLCAIRLNTPVQQLGTRLAANAERHLRPLERLRRLYPAALLAESVRIAQRCSFTLGELRYEYPEEVVPPGMTPAAWLRRLVLAGAQQRWPDGVPPRARELIEKELALIGELAYEYYFLTVHDIVQFARGNGILCQGRGSAANSAVCYCLFITEVDPDRSAMLFERFISKERNEPPDIDVDFEHERREEVIQYIYRKYTRERAALAATVISYRPRSAVRDVGKALGLDPLFVEQLAKSLSWWDRHGDLARRFAEENLAAASSMAGHFMRLVHEILGFPRHLSQHVGGFIITRSPISALVPVENAAMADRTVIQWDKNDIEALGLLKVDILALGMLSALRRSFALIRAAHGVEIDMSRIPAEDPCTFAMLARADSVGVFQVESRAQMAMLPRLKPRTFYDLVIEVAIVRPGPIQGDMVHPYLKRRQGLEPVTYPNEEIRAVLERTLGVPIFQEQVIKLAMVAAGFSGGEADQLRRAMAAWKRNGSLEAFERKVIDGMLARGHGLDFAQRLFNQMKGFGDYGFPGVACGELRAAGLRLGLAEVPLPRRLLLRAAEQPADGFLLALAAGAGPAPPRCRGAAGRRGPQRVGLHAGEPGARQRPRCASACARSAASTPPRPSASSPRAGAAPSTTCTISRAARCSIAASWTCWPAPARWGASAATATRRTGRPRRSRSRAPCSSAPGARPRSRCTMRSSCPRPTRPRTWSRTTAAPGSRWDAIRWRCCARERPSRAAAARSSCRRLTAAVSCAWPGS